MHLFLMKPAFEKLVRIFDHSKHVFSETPKWQSCRLSYVVAKPFGGHLFCKNKLQSFSANNYISQIWYFAIAKMSSAQLHFFICSWKKTFFSSFANFWSFFSKKIQKKKFFAYSSSALSCVFFWVLGKNFETFWKVL